MLTRGDGRQDDKTRGCSLQAWWNPARRLRGKYHVAPVSREPLQVLQDAFRQRLVSEDGEPITLALLPPLSEQEMADFRRVLPMELPTHIERLLRFCHAVEGASASERIDFTGRSISGECSDAFPHGLPIAEDGWGNFWMVDLQPSSTEFGPVYFVCHDPPITLFQSSTLADFLTEVFKMDTPPHTSLVDDVHEDRLYDVWRKQPGTMPQGAAASSSDPVLREFAARLSKAHVIVDLRNAKPGQGFAWGRYGMNAVSRCGADPIFALARKKSILTRLLGR